MHLAGQEHRTHPASGIQPAASHAAAARKHAARDEAGYAMAALLTMLAVMAILLSAALPVWRHEIQREKEAELAFRGEQYVHAIGLFQRRFATFPQNVDVLVQQKFLRKKYIDPITGKDFRPLYVGQLQQQQQQAQQQQQQQQRPGGTSAPRPSPGLGLGARQQPPAGVGGLMGVASTSEANSIRIYKGRTKYNQWEFVFAGATTRPGGGPQAPGNRGPGGPGSQRPGFPGGRGPGQGPGMDRPRGPGGADQRPLPPGGPLNPPRPPGGN